MSGIEAISIFKITLAVAVSAVVVVDDLRFRQIPNRLCVALLVTGVVSSGMTRGWSGLQDGFFGAAIAFAVFLIPYALGGMGGGDVKLMAGFGAVTGLQGVMPALFLAVVAGALTSVVYLLAGRMRKRTAPAAIPYAPAIVAGSLIVAFSQMGGSSC